MDSKQKGGWENSVQTALVPFFKQNISCLVAQREVTHVFNTAESDDFVCPTHHGKQPPFFIIELKCQSTFQDTVSETRFAQRLQEGVTKVQQDLEKSFDGAEKWVIGNCCNIEIAKATVRYRFVPHDCMNVIPVQDGDHNFQVFYARFTS